jgi:hypothetical protein
MTNGRIANARQVVEHLTGCRTPTRDGSPTWPNVSAQSPTVPNPQRVADGANRTTRAGAREATRGHRTRSGAGISPRKHARSSTALDRCKLGDGANSTTKDGASRAMHCGRRTRLHRWRITGPRTPFSVAPVDVPPTMPASIAVSSHATGPTRRNEQGSVSWPRTARTIRSTWTTMNRAAGPAIASSMHGAAPEYGQVV